MVVSDEVLNKLPKWRGARSLGAREPRLSRTGLGVILYDYQA